MWQSAPVRAAPVPRTTFRRSVPIPRCYSGFAGLRRTEYFGIVRTDRECMTGLLNHGIGRGALGILRCWRRFFGRYTCALERVGSPVERPKRLRDKTRHIIRLQQRSETRYCGGVGKVPLVLGDADEIADRRLAHPGTAKRGPGHCGRYPGLQEGAEIRAGGNRIDRRQARRIEGPKG